jgi:hypothetical protein
VSGALQLPPSIEHIWSASFGATAPVSTLPRSPARRGSFAVD